MTTNNASSMMKAQKYKDEFSIGEWNADLPEMTLEELKKCALQHGGYETPELNDILYLHFKGYKKIENLTSYVGLKALYLDSNGFGKIENINHLSDLRCLFLHKNLFTTIENLHGLNNLVQLDLSDNRITLVQGLSALPILATLNLSRNLLSDGISISHLKECSTQLTTLDLSFNQLQGQDVIQQLIGISSIIVLEMKENPIVCEMSHFRKKCIVGLPKLKSLDSPVFDVERISAEAWAVGGNEAEVNARQDWQQKQKASDRQNLAKFRVWKDNVRDQRQTERLQEAMFGCTEQMQAKFERSEKLFKDRMRQAANDSESERVAFVITGVNDDVMTGPPTDYRKCDETLIGHELAPNIDMFSLDSTETDASETRSISSASLNQIVGRGHVRRPCVGNGDWDDSWNAPEKSMVQVSTTDFEIHPLLKSNECHATDAYDEDAAFEAKIVMQQTVEESSSSVKKLHVSIADNLASKIMVVTSFANHPSRTFIKATDTRDEDAAFKEEIAMNHIVDESLSIYRAEKGPGRTQESVYAARSTWCDDDSEEDTTSAHLPASQFWSRPLNTLLPAEHLPKMESSTSEQLVEKKKIQSERLDDASIHNTSILRHQVHTDGNGKQLTWEQMGTLPAARRIIIYSALPQAVVDNYEDDEGDAVLSTVDIRSRHQASLMALDEGI